MLVILQNDSNNRKTIWVVADLSLSSSFTSLTFTNINMSMHKYMYWDLPYKNRCSGATGGLGIAYHYDTCDLFAVRSGASVAQPFVFCVLFFSPIVYLLAIALSVLLFMASEYCSIVTLFVEL